MASFADDDVILSAMMPKKSIVWQDRFIVLLSDRIEYFTDSTKSTKKGDLPVTELTMVEGMIGSKHGGFKFTVKTGLRSLTMAASSAEMREEWTLAIRKLAQLKVSEANIKEISSPAAAATTASSAKQASMRRRKQSTGAPTAPEADGGAHRSGSEAAPTAAAARPPARTAAPTAAADQLSVRQEGVVNTEAVPRTRTPSHPVAAASTAAAAATAPTASEQTRGHPQAAAAATGLVEGSDWERVDSPEGTYYYHKKTRVSRWDMPDELAAAAVNNRIEDTERSADSAFQMRKEQMELEKIAAAEKEEIMEHIKPEVMQLLSSWQESSPGNPNDLVTLINTLPSILPHLHEESTSGRYVPYLRADASESEVKKAYFRAIRFLHPDKLPASLDLCDKMVAEHAFAYLCEVFQLYREIIADNN